MVESRDPPVRSEVKMEATSDTQNRRKTYRPGASQQRPELPYSSMLSMRDTSKAVTAPAAIWTRKPLLALPTSGQTALYLREPGGQQGNERDAFTECRCLEECRPAERLSNCKSCPLPCLRFVSATIEQLANRELSGHFWTVAIQRSR